MNSSIDASANFGAKDLLMSGGVSRSGRLLKKSAKLLDFQSSDEVEKKPRRSNVKHNARRSRLQRSSNIEFELSSNEVDDMEQLGDLTDLVELNDTAVDLDLEVKLLDVETGVVNDDNSTDQMVSNKALLESLLNADPDSEDELNKIVANIVEGVEAESLQCKNSVRTSLYMTEKANKRKIMRDGKIITGKLERKDKGKSRYTAYSLWAKEYRKSGKLNNYQDADLPNTSRRLGELWSNVSNKEKNIWRRKAKQQSLKREQERNSVNAGMLVAAPKVSSPVSDGYNTKFLNRATTSRTKKLAEAAAAAAVAASSVPNKSLEVSKRGRKKLSEVKQEQKVDEVEKIDIKQTDVAVLQAVHVSQEPGIQAIDAAAHLKLLGESLSIIGQRLKEHDGQIAMSGSLSVLLDSVLCSLGPLMCLTTHIPGFEHDEHLHKNLASILDNIAYVLPGL